MKRTLETCPICGAVNVCTYSIDSFYGGAIMSEDFYNCDECTYFRCFAYGAEAEGIVEGYDKRYEDNVQRMHLNVFTKIERRHLPI